MCVCVCVCVCVCACVRACSCACVYVSWGGGGGGAILTTVHNQYYEQIQIMAGSGVSRNVSLTALDKDARLRVHKQRL